MTYTLKPLPYDYNALEPHLDEATLRIHHGKHHQGYVNKLNKAAEEYEGVANNDYSVLFNQPVEILLKSLDTLTFHNRAAIVNNAGGIWNHDFFWESMGPNCGGEAKGKLAEAITKEFGSFNAFKEAFSSSAAKVFGSGWTWLVLHKGQLLVENTTGHNCPLSEGKTPLLVIDVWEHTYYLKYQNKRLDFIAAWWNLVNWKKVEERYSNS